MHLKLSILSILLPISVTLGQNPNHPMNHDHMEHRFDQPEELANRFDDPARDSWQKPDMVIAALNLKPNQVVADVGAGTGYFTVRLAKLEVAPKVYASDIEPSMVTYLKECATKEGLKNIYPCISEMQHAGFKLSARYDFLPRQHFLVFQIASP